MNGVMRNHKILFIYPNLIGPYHQERIEAFHEIGCEPIVWEILRQPDAGYSWKIDHQHFSFRYLRFTPLSLLTTGLSNYISSNQRKSSLMDGTALPRCYFRFGSDGSAWMFQFRVKAMGRLA